MKNNLLYIITLFLLIVSCKSTEKEISDWEQKELASGKRYDSLFFNLKLGMQKKAFYDSCWSLNRRKIVKEGNENMTVLYQFKNEAEDVILFNFYPEFTNNRTYKYNTTMHYLGWALWNEQYFSSKMYVEAQKILMDWYGGNDFINVKLEDGLLHGIKIDGNRKIDMCLLNEMKVLIIFSDTSFK